MTGDPGTATRGMAISTRTVTLASHGERRFEAYAATPDDARGPGILICTEMWGVTDAKRALAAEYARRGFCAIVPNVFWRSDPSGVVDDEGPARGVAWRRLRAFDFHRAALDMSLAVDWLRASASCSGKVASIGFCMGGRIALLAALRSGADLAISLYALGITDHIDELKQAACPVQLHYGLADQHIPRSEIEQVQAASAGKDNIEIWTYPGIGHGFFNPERPAYDAAAVALATARIDRLLLEMA
jgi:carboxymethylenebutenolidase